MMKKSHNIPLTTRQTWADDRFHKCFTKCQNWGISWLYLESPWEMNSNKYNYVWYWFINSWNTRKTFPEIWEFERAKILLFSKVAAPSKSLKWIVSVPNFSPQVIAISIRVSSLPYTGIERFRTDQIASAEPVTFEFNDIIYKVKVPDFLADFDGNKYFYKYL